VGSPARCCRAARTRMERHAGGTAAGREAGRDGPPASSRPDRRTPRAGFEVSPLLPGFGIWDLGVGIFSEGLGGAWRGEIERTVAGLAGDRVLAAHLEEIEPVRHRAA